MLEWLCLSTCQYIILIFVSLGYLVPYQGFEHCCEILPVTLSEGIMTGALVGSN